MHVQFCYKLLQTIIRKWLMRRRRQIANIPNPTHINRQVPQHMAATDIRYELRATGHTHPKPSHINWHDPRPATHGSRRHQVWDAYNGTHASQTKPLQLAWPTTRNTRQLQKSDMRCVLELPTHPKPSHLNWPDSRAYKTEDVDRSDPAVKPKNYTNEVPNS